MFDHIVDGKMQPLYHFLLHQQAPGNTPVPISLHAGFDNRDIAHPAFQDFIDPRILQKIISVRVREKSHGSAPADVPVKLVILQRRLPREKVFIILRQSFIQQDFLFHVFHVFREASSHRFRVQPMCVQNLPNLPQGETEIPQPNAFNQKHGGRKGIVTVSAFAAAGRDDPLILIMFQQVRGNPQVFCEFANPIFLQVRRLQTEMMILNPFFSSLIIQGCRDFFKCD